MARQLLGELKTRLTEELAAHGVLRLTSGVLALTDLAEPVSTMLDRLTIAVENPLVRLDESALSVSGRAVICSNIRVQATALFREADGRIRLSGALQPETDLHLSDIVQVLLGHAARVLEGVTVSNLHLVDPIGEKGFALQATTSGIMKGPAGLEIHDLAVAIGSEAGTVRGTATLAGKDLALVAALPGEISFAGQLPAMDLTALARTLNAPFPKLPDGFQLALPESHFAIRFNDGGPELVLRVLIAGWGALTLWVTEVAGSWGTAVALHLAEDWRFSHLSNILKPLDQLKIANSILSLAPFDSADELTIPNVDPDDLTQEALKLSKGFALSAELALQGLGLQYVARLIGRKSLPLMLAVGDIFADATVSTTLDDVPLLPGIATLSHFGLTLDAKTLTLSLHSNATLHFFRATLEFEGNGSVDDGGLSFSLSTRQDWKKPLGIPCLTIKEGATFEISVKDIPAYGVKGTAIIAGRNGDVTVKMAVQFVGSVPSLLYLHIPDKVGLLSLANDLLGTNLPLPGALDIWIEKTEFRLVTDPLGVKIGNERFNPGLTLAGTIEFLGLAATAAVIIDRGQGGIYAHAALSHSIDILGILKITDEDGYSPPYFTLDSRHSPFLVISGQLSLLGLKDSIAARVDDHGIAVRVKHATGLVHVEAEIQVAEDTLAGSFCLSLVGHTYMTGSVQAEADHLCLQGDLDLFPSGFPLQVTGCVAARWDANAITLDADALVKLNKLPLANDNNGHVTISSEAVTVLFRLFDRSLTFAWNADRRLATGEFDWHLPLRIGPIKEPNTGTIFMPPVDISCELKVALTIGSHEFAATVSGAFDFLGQPLTLPVFTIGWQPDKIPASPAEFEEIIRDYIRDRAYELCSSVVKNPPKWGLTIPRQWHDFEHWASDEGDKLVDWFKITGGPIVLLPGFALDGIARLPLDRWNIAMTWDPGAWHMIKDWKPATWSDVLPKWTPGDFAAASKLHPEAWKLSGGWDGDDWNVAFKLEGPDWEQLLPALALGADAHLAEEVVSHLGAKVDHVLGGSNTAKKIKKWTKHL